MPTLPVPYDEILEAVRVFHEALDTGYEPDPPSGMRSAQAAASKQLGMNQPNGRTYIEKRLDIATALGVQVRSWRSVDDSFINKTLLRYRTYDQEYRDAESRLTRPGRAPPGAPRAGHLPSGQRTGWVLHTPTPPLSSIATGMPASRAADSKAVVKDARRRTRGKELNAQADALLERVKTTVVEPLPPTLEELAAKIVPTLRRGPLGYRDLMEKIGATAENIEHIIHAAHTAGANIAFRGGKWHLDDAPALGSQRPVTRQLVTDSNGYLTFGGTADAHLCSKFERLDCLNDYYDHVQRRGISIVLNGGNYVDGEAPFNKHEIHTHGLDAQMQYLAKNYPQRAGVENWVISGADHEGFYSRREGVDIGKYAENVMRQNGRTDWHDMGYMECFIPIVHGATGKSSQLCLMHAGGGSAYAISYAPQKLVEAFDGGDKPAVLLIGHYHKASYQLTRNVHVVQLGCFEDQTIFMRQKKLSAHLGGWFLNLHVDPDTGAVDEFTCTFRNYYVRDYYNGRWSQHGPVTHADRGVRR
jgi:hypothetical protein